MTNLAIFRVFDERFFCFRVLADYIRGTGFDACPAADAAFDLFDGHNFLLFLKFAYIVFNKDFLQSRPGFLPGTKFY